MINLRVVAIWNKLRLFTQPGTRFSRRVLNAGFWMLAVRVVGRALSVVRIVLLARLLMPEDFGVMGIALLFMSILQSLTQTGFRRALVQRKGDIRGYLDTAWVTNFMQRFLLGGILFASGPWIAGFFNSPTAGPIVQAMGGVLALDGLTNIGIIYFEKELQFHKSFIYSIGVIFTDLVVCISAALILRNVWALVFGALASKLVGVALSYWIHPYRPRLSFDLQKAKELFKFGRWVFLHSIVNTLSLRADSFVIGKFLGVQSLGYYQIALRISEEPIQEIRVVTDNVAFPTYSKVQDNLLKLRQAFLGTVGLVAGITLPLAVVILFIAPDFTRLVLGEKWMPAVTAMQVLGFAAAIRATTGTSGLLYMGVGRPSMNFHMNLLRALVLLALIYPLIKMFDITGVAIAVLLSGCATLPFLVWYPKKVLKVKATQLTKALVPPICISLAMSMGILVAKQVAGQVNLGEFVLILCVAAAAYAAFAFLLWRFFRSGPVQILALLRGRN